ncbi:hypothetical protein OA57_03500 [Chelonobacter oris]|uniref:Lipoprotein n=1 Tax=Chelonobacter oris TaxID=505317 RepID=A0A0A3AU67_9PAST|nr:hypothetical protein [Chelonobacter oris]KGQ71297.1 hypothetical protein OA57_03500 [Chelonobacter oris]
MKKLSIIFPFIISGCYLANGSPSQYKFWVKHHTSVEERKNDWASCRKISNNNFSESDKSLLEKGKTNWENLYSKKQDYEHYSYLIKKKDAYFRNCIYQLGYRFKAPLYWCLAQDGDNTGICMENLKYRN